jgi:hypothetical protein
MSANNRIPIGFQTLTVSGSAVGLTVPTAANIMAIISVENNSVRYRDDGTNPTASIGFLLYPGNTLNLENLTVLNATKFIAVDGTDATLSIGYYQQQ